MTARILVADDEESLRLILKNFLTQKGYATDVAADGREASTLLQNPYDLALLDIRMPHQGGLELLEKIRRQGKKTQVLIMTAQDTMKNAVEAMKGGAFDYISKPFDMEELAILIAKALRERALEAEVEALREEVREIQSGPHTLVGESRPIKEIFKMIGKLASRDVTVLIQGESGTGKELIARAIHRESPRASHPFIPVNVAAVPPNLLESELFGSVKGAFTGAEVDRGGYFEKANRGTLFLDEIGDMPLALQAKILRVLQEREIQRVGDARPVSVDVRIIAATNQNLEQMVKQKKFREDLFYRLNVVPLSVPPLRVRRDDIPLLADYFVGRFCKELGSPPKRISKEAAALLKKQAWPGNVRELENVVKRGIVLSPGGAILPEVILPFLSDGLESANVDEIALEEIIRKKLDSFLAKWEGYDVEDLYEAVIKRVEKPLLELVLKKAKWNQIRAAKMLGINRNTLHKRIKELKIQPLP